MKRVGTILKTTVLSLTAIGSIFLMIVTASIIAIETDAEYHPTKSTKE